MSTYRPSYSSRRGGYDGPTSRDDHRDDRNRSYYNGPPQPPPPGVDAGRYDDRDHRRRSPPTYPDYRRERRDSRDYDTYRPDTRPPQGSFTFRVDKPAGIDDTLGDDTYRPSQQNGSARYQGARGRGQGPRRGRYAKRIPAERDLLRVGSTKAPEIVFNGGDSVVTYMPLEDLSDDEEAIMDISDQSDAESGEPTSKRARHEVSQSEADNSAPKWSNPDPYTALPPPDESQRKKKDVVKLIRKARVDASDKLTSTTEAEDYISFDLDDSDSGEVQVNGTSANYEPPTFAPGASTGPSVRVDPPIFVHGAPTGPRSLPSTQTAESNSLPPRNGLPPRPQPAFSTQPPVATSGRPDRTPAPAARSQNPVSDPLGSRKRTFDDRIKPAPNRSKKNITMPVNGRVLPHWEPIHGETACPWVTTDHSQTSELSVWLHKEVMDFYEYVKPRQFEQQMRARLVENLRQVMGRSQQYSRVQIYPFGSFMSGLYLPTGDMDIVICSQEWLKNRPSPFRHKGSFYKFAQFLVDKGIAIQESLEVIASARVPIVKYIDRESGLKVDISFDRMDGPNAINTFLKWKEQYPALSILVTVIKHFLVMRGLNEPVNGGIGSFSVICLVVSMLQLMPQVQSRSLIPEHHLGEMLMEFFDLYGRKFDYKNVAIRMNPPGYIHKTNVRGFTYKNLDRLSILDPNNAVNDISGGSSNTPVIFYDFESARKMIQERMIELSESPAKRLANPSILETILEGNYESFRKQRAHLRQLYEKTIGPCSD